MPLAFYYGSGSSSSPPNLRPACLVATSNLSQKCQRKQRLRFPIWVIISEMAKFHQKQHETHEELKNTNPSHFPSRCVRSFNFYSFQIPAYPSWVVELVHNCHPGPRNAFQLGTNQAWKFIARTQMKKKFMFVKHKRREAIIYHKLSITRLPGGV